ncbi:MAG: VPLPA-CTERM sorting domain-containing protein [Pseudolabrys sp.]
MKSSFLISAILSSVIATATSANADSLFNFSGGNPTDAMASASRPDVSGSFEIESADDFVLTGGQTSINSASFTGLVVPGTGGTPSVSQVTVEIYRVFPLDSTLPPSGHVPTRNNSPSDVAFDSRDSAAGSLNFTTAALAATFTALNSVQAGGIHPAPGQTTGGNGSITGQEVQFNVTFNTPFNLPADHYFFVPQVSLTDGGQFYWLSAARPIVSPGTPFPAGFTDLQSWTRDANLDPDWLRIGMDIVGGTTPPAFNAAFSLDGVETPLPAALPLFATGLGALGLLSCRRKRKQAA